MRAVVLLLAASCSGAAEVPRDQQAPPFALDLSMSDEIAEGYSFEVVVSNAPANATVVLAASGQLAGNQACPAPISPTCLYLFDPVFVVAQGRADASGVATLTMDVPSSVPVSQVTFQAVSRTATDVSTSNLVVADVVLPVDTDLDGLLDFEETALGTDPSDPDSDGDDLLDGAEVSFGLDPLEPDTDGGGATDGDELFTDGTDPLDPSDDLPDLSFVPEFASVFVRFSYNQSADRAESWTGFSGTRKAPYVTVTLFDSGWSGSHTDIGHHCYVTAESLSSSIPNASWVSSYPSTLFGINLGLLTESADTCAGVVDPAVWSNLSSGVATTDWAVGVKPQLDPAFEAAMLAAGADPAIVADLLGGFYLGDIGRLYSFTGVLPTVGTDGNLVDQNFDPIMDASGSFIGLTRSEMLVGGALQDGQYNVQVTVPAWVVEALITP